MGVKVEYALMVFVTLFTGLTLLSLSMLGLAQIDDYYEHKQPSLVDGFKHFYNNPFTSGWEKTIYTLLVISPLSIIGGAMILNYLRGRG